MDSVYSEEVVDLSPDRRNDRFKKGGLKKLDKTILTKQLRLQILLRIALRASAAVAIGRLGHSKICLAYL
jgi:hypothetical protein